MVEKLVDALALPQIFQCVRSCGASLVARASTWSRILKKNPDAVVMTPASLLHCQVFHLALPRTDRALFGLRVEWGIKPLALIFYFCPASYFPFCTTIIAFFYSQLFCKKKTYIF